MVQGPQIQAVLREKGELLQVFWSLQWKRDQGEKRTLSDISISNYSSPTSEHICGIKYATVKRKNIETELE